MYGVWLWRSAVSTGRGRRQGAIGDGGLAPGGSHGERGLVTQKLRQLLDDVVIQSIRYVENYLLEKNHD